MIYFLRLDSGDIKIGKTINLPARLYEHRREGRYGSKLEVLAVKDGDQEEEKRIHAMFADLRVNSTKARLYGPVETFRPGKDLLAFIEQHCRKPDMLDMLCETTGKRSYNPCVTLAPFALTRNGRKISKKSADEC